MFNPDDEDPIDDNHLPFGLNQQLRDLLLNGAVNEDHGLQLYFGGVLGGDEDFGFNPGDEELFLLDSDDDDSYIDADGDEDNYQKIFVSLQDSQVIRRLSFHKNVEGVYRFPKTDPTSPGECYEEIYRLLEEVELLLKVWRRRVSHPYTAHIIRSPPPPSPHPGEGALREGCDYNQSDYEYDSDEEDDYDNLPPVGTNESLTKKKFCHSAKVFHEVFDSEKQLDVFLRYIARMRKNIFSIMFSLFMDALPAETAARLPSELWEKVWKFSQNPYFRYKDSVPMLLDTTYYKAGWRADTGKGRALERERARELFGAVGNIHMILFEILYKNPCILQPSPMYELEAGDDAADKFARSVWSRHTGLLRQKYSRFQQLELFLSPQEEPASAATGDMGTVTPVLSPEQKLESGIFTIRDIPLPSMRGVDPSMRLDSSCSITGEGQCGVVLLLSSYPMDQDKLGLLLVVMTVITGEVVAVIKTGHDNHFLLMEVASHKVKRRHVKVQWKKHFCITDSRVTYLHRDADEFRDHVTVWSWPLPPRDGGGPTPTVLEPAEPLICKQMASNLPAADDMEHIHNQALNRNRFRHNTSCTVRHTNNRIAIVHQNPYIVHSSFEVYEADSGKVISSREYPDVDLCLAGVQNNRALLADITERRAIFVSLDTGKFIHTFTAESLNLHFGLDGHKWEVKFDSNEARKQFLVNNRSLSAYKMMSYTTENETDPPVELYKGVGGDNGEYCGRNQCLVNGLIFSNCRRELSDGTAPIDMYEDLAIKCHEVSAYGLKSKSKLSLLTMATSKEEAAQSLLNELSLRWFDPPGPNEGQNALWDPEKRSIFAISDTMVAVMMETKTVRIINLDTDPKTVAEIESEQVWACVEAERIAREKDEEAKKKREEKRQKRQEEMKRKKQFLAEQFVGKEVVISGNIIEWRHTYGFAKSKGPANKLGRVFLHRNDVAATDRRQLRKGATLEYQIVTGREPGTYRATEIKVVPRPPRQEGSTGSGSDSARGKGERALVKKGNEEKSNIGVGKDVDGGECSGKDDNKKVSNQEKDH